MPDNNQKNGLEKYDSKYIMSLYNKIFNDERFVLDVKADGNCQCWSVIQAVNKNKIEYTQDDWKLMRAIRQKSYDLDFRDNGEGGCIKNDGVYFDGQEAFFGYKGIMDDKNFFFTIIKQANPEDIFNVTYSGSSYKNMFIDLKNGGPAVIAQNRHYKTINWENRDEFCRKLLKLLMSRNMYSIKNKDPDGIKNYFVSVIDNFFYTDEDEYDENELTKNLEKIFDDVEDKKDKYIELINFFYSEFERVYISESKTPKASEFLSMLLKNFKEKYISAHENSYDYMMQLCNQIFNDERFVLNVKGDGNCWIWSAIQAVSKKKIQYTEDDWKLMRAIRQKLGNYYNDEGKCVKDDGVWYDGLQALKAYKKLTNNKDFSYMVIRICDRTCKDASVLPIIEFNYKHEQNFMPMFIDLKNGGPAVVGQNSHWRTINWENRDEFCRKLLKLIITRSAYLNRNADTHNMKDQFMNVIDDFFYSNDKNNNYDAVGLVKNLDELFDGIEDKEDKYIELIKFFYSEFERVYINENKTPKANEFLSMLLKNFKEKYIISSDDKKIDNAEIQDSGDKISEKPKIQEKIDYVSQETPKPINQDQKEQEFNNKINDLSSNKNLDGLEKYYKNLTVTDKQKFIETAKNKAIEEAKKTNQKLKNLVETKDKKSELDFGPIKTYLKNCANLFCDKKNRKKLLDQIEKLDVMRFYNYISELIRRIFNFKSERSKFGFKKLKESRALRNFVALNERMYTSKDGNSCRN